MRTRLQLCGVLVAWTLSGLSLLATAEEPAATTAVSKENSDKVHIDRDGKRVCGWSLMSDSEHGGYTNLMHKTNELSDRDEIRADHCARMRARAKERGVPAEE